MTLIDGSFAFDFLINSVTLVLVGRGKRDTPTFSNTVRACKVIARYNAHSKTYTAVERKNAQRCSNYSRDEIRNGRKMIVFAVSSQRKKGQARERQDKIERIYYDKSFIRSQLFFLRKTFSNFIVQQP